MLSFAIVMGMIPGTDFTITAYADGDKTISGLGTGAIANPTSGAGGWSYVYYGTYNGNSVKYRVLDKKTTEFSGTTMLLDCDSTLINKAHDSQSPYEHGENGWTNSEINAWLNGNGFYNNTNQESEVSEQELVVNYPQSGVLYLHGQQTRRII